MTKPIKREEIQVCGDCPMHHWDKGYEKAECGETGDDINYDDDPPSKCPLRQSDLIVAWRPPEEP